MAVYVDNMAARFRGMTMCHIWADTEAELLDMVDKIGVKRKWIQGHPTLSTAKARKASWVHFDICKSKRKLAVLAGAIETDKYGPLEHKARVDIDSGLWSRVKSGTDRLKTIESLRAQGFGHKGLA